MFKVSHKNENKINFILKCFFVFSFLILILFSFQAKPSYAQTEYVNQNLEDGVDVTGTTGLPANPTQPSVVQPTTNTSTECGGKNNFNCYTLLEPYGAGGGEGVAKTVLIKEEGGLGSYLQTLMFYLLIMTTIAAVFYMVYGGALYLTTDMVSQKSEGREIITRVIIGLIFVFSVWTIMNSINSGLLKNALDFSLNSIGIKVKEIHDDHYEGDTAVVGVPSGDRCSPIPDSELATIPGSVHRAKKVVVENFINMKAEAAKEGLYLTPTSGYRSPQRQKEIFDEFKCTVVSGKSSCPGGKLVALPCVHGGAGSNHSTGEALDINVSAADASCRNGNTCSSKLYTWLKNNGGKYGFTNALPKDPVHWSKTGN